MGSELFDFAVITIFAREALEGSIIIGEYRTIIIRGDQDTLQAGLSKRDALRVVTTSALIATALALIVIAAIAIPLSVLSRSFDDSTSKIIEGVSKIVAGICLLQLSLKLPKFLGIYGSCKENSSPEQRGLSKRSIRFNVMWNIWREVAEIGVFLIPFFLTGERVKAIPLSGLVGSACGLFLGVLIYYANKTFKRKLWLAVFASLLLVFLSAGLLTGGVHNLEVEIGSTKQVWEIEGEFWDVHRLPMTALKPFGYNDSRTVLEIVCYWGWLALSALLHYRKYRRAPKPPQKRQETFALTEEEGGSSDEICENPPSSDIKVEDGMDDTADIGDSIESMEDGSLHVRALQLTRAAR